MNLRELCQIRSFPVVLLTTFNFDPLFFERVVLTDLLAGGAKKIIVMADANQAYESVEKVQDQLIALGRKYMLIPVSAGSSFHSKLCIRLSTNGAVVACGSHNISRSGWLGRLEDNTSGGNREVSTAWRVEPDSQSAFDLKRVLELLSDSCDDSQSGNAILELLDIDWLANAQQQTSGNYSWVLTGKDTTLASLLERRWEGRQFDRLRIVTGSTDNSAAMIRWATNKFGIKKAFLEVDRDCCGLDPLLLEDIPIDFRLHLTDGNPRSHLKVFVFESDQSSAAVIGSANCSGAAWLRSSENGGNIESVVIHEECDPAEFHPLFLMNDDKSISWDKAGLDTQVDQKKSEEDPLPIRQLRQVQIEKSAKSIYVRLSPNPTIDQSVFVIIGDQKLELEYLLDEDIWASRSVELQSHICTPFAWVEIGISSKPTNSVWIDDLDSLSDISDWQLPSRIIPNLNKNMMSKDRKKLLNDLRLLSSTLLNNKDDFKDTVLSQHQKVKDEDDENAKPIDPQSLIKSITELQDGTQHLTGGTKLSSTVTLIGIMRVLFHEANNRASSYDPTDAESKKSKEEKEENIKKDSNNTNDPTIIDEPTEKEKKRLLQQLNEFVDKLSSTDFADRCSARQLQQALAYPLAVIRFVTQGPLVYGIEAELSNIVVRVIEVMLKREINLSPDSKQRKLKPLLQEVYQRYCKENRKEDFLQVVCDGVLWLVLMSSLAMIEKEEKYFEFALLIGDIARNDFLTATATPNRVAMLAKRLANGNLPVIQLKNIGHVAEAVISLEKYLGRCWDNYDQSERVFDDKVGDWLWRPKIGFARITKLGSNHTNAYIHMRSRAIDLQNVVQLNYYVNIRQLQANDIEVITLINAIDDLVCNIEMQ